MPFQELGGKNGFFVLEAAKTGNTADIIAVINENQALAYYRDKVNLYLFYYLSIALLFFEYQMKPISLSILSYHIISSIDLIQIPNQEKKTALHWSAINGHKDICSLLVEALAEVNALDDVC